MWGVLCECVTHLIQSSLSATIRFRRPDLASQLPTLADGVSISDNPPKGYFAKHVHLIADIGEPVNPCFFTNSNTNPANW